MNKVTRFVIAPLVLTVCGILLVMLVSNQKTNSIFAEQTAVAQLPTLTASSTQVKVVVQVVTATPTPSKTSTTTPTVTPSKTPNIPATITQAYVLGVTEGAPTLTATATLTNTPTATATWNVAGTVTAAFVSGQLSGLETAKPTSTATLTNNQGTATFDAKLAQEIAKAGVGTLTPSATFTPTVTYTPSPTGTMTPIPGFVEWGKMKLSDNSETFSFYIPEDSKADNGAVSFQLLNYSGTGVLQIDPQTCGGSISFPWDPSTKLSIVSDESSYCVMPAEGYWTTLTLQVEQGLRIVVTPY